MNLCSLPISRDRTQRLCHSGPTGLRVKTYICTFIHLTSTRLRNNVKRYIASFENISKRIARTIKAPLFFFILLTSNPVRSILKSTFSVTKDSAGSSQCYFSNTRYIPLALLDCFDLLRNTVRPSMNSLGDYWPVCLLIGYLGSRYCGRCIDTEEGEY